MQCLRLSEPRPAPLGPRSSPAPVTTCTLASSQRVDSALSLCHRPKTKVILMLGEVPAFTCRHAQTPMYTAWLYKLAMTITTTSCMSHVPVCTCHHALTICDAFQVMACIKKPTPKASLVTVQECTDWSLMNRMFVLGSNFAV